MIEISLNSLRFAGCFTALVLMGGCSQPIAGERVDAPDTPRQQTSTTRSALTQPARTTTRPAAVSGRTYTIRPGDNLWDISKQVYGDGTKYERILNANPALNPDNMKPGTKIVIP